MQSPGRSVSVSIDESAGGRVVAAVFDGFDVVGEGVADDPARDWYRGIFPLAPWAGTIPGGSVHFDGERHDLGVAGTDAVHGTVSDVAWSIERVATDRARLSCPLGAAGHWPFGGAAIMEVAVDEEDVRVTLSVTAAERAMPAAVGLHPWFTRRGPDGILQIRWPAVERFDPDRAGPWHPTSELRRPPWDDMFRLVDDPVLTWPGGPSLRLRSDAERWVRFDASADAVCIEPWTNDPGSFATGLARRLAPHESASVELHLVREDDASSGQPQQRQ
ncbi:aldose epimerase family protein [Microbacterium lacticum]